MEPKQSALGNVMSQMGGVQDPNAMPPQPGERTDHLIGALRALQQYNKTTMERDPQDEDLKMVRKMIMDLSSLLKKDQMEDGEQEQPDTAEGQMDMMSGAPEMPSLEGFGLK